MHTICSLSLSALKQVMAAYFQEESIGDVGGSKAKYSPKRGHPGTLVSISTVDCFTSASATWIYYSSLVFCVYLPVLSNSPLIVPLIVLTCTCTCTYFHHRHLVRISKRIILLRNCRIECYILGLLCNSSSSMSGKKLNLT